MSGTSAAGVAANALVKVFGSDLSPDGLLASTSGLFVFSAASCNPNSFRTAAFLDKLFNWSIMSL